MHKQVYCAAIMATCVQTCLDDDKMDTESPTLSMAVIHALFSLAAKQAWDVQLIDADTAFLNAAPNVLSLPCPYTSMGKDALVRIRLKTVSD